jgi:hypothetical protein
MTTVSPERWSSSSPLIAGSEKAMHFVSTEPSSYRTISAARFGPSWAETVPAHGSASSASSKAAQRHHRWRPGTVVAPARAFTLYCL